MSLNKLKAWDNDRKAMTKVKAIDYDCNEEIVTCHLEYANGVIEKKYPDDVYGDDIVFLQYIGRKDIDGEEIYAEDILEVISEDGEKEIVVVKWDSEDSGYKGYIEENTKQPKWMLSGSEKFMRKIGNINSDLR